MAGGFLSLLSSLCVDPSILCFLISAYLGGLRISDLFANRHLLLSSLVLFCSCGLWKLDLINPKIPHKK